MALAQPKADDPRSAEAIAAAARELNFSAPIADALGAIAAEAGWEADRLEAHLSPSMADIMPPRLLPDMDKAAARVARAVRDGETIGLVCDHDADGTSASVIYIKALTEALGHPAEKIRLVVSHRLKEGYGLCQPVAERIKALDATPSLILTADCGSGDSERIQWLAAQIGAETIVTDHHGSGEAVPGAYAFVNPKRPDANPEVDTTIAGCMVAWCLMAHTWRVMADQDGPGPAGDRKAISALLDYAALGTLADCVDISGTTNRAVLHYGLARMSAGARPCWNVARAWAKRAPWEPLWSEDIAFQVAPRIAASGRLDASRPGIRFLYARDDAEARHFGGILDRDNQERRRIQSEMLDGFLENMEPAEKLTSPVVVVGSEEGHAGVQGICAARLADLYARPAFVLTLPPGTAGWRGSARAGSETVNLRELLAWVERQRPGILKVWGGHHAAAGFTLSATDEATLFAFADALGAAAQALGYDQLGGSGHVYGDAVVDRRVIGPQLLSELNRIEPFGKGFRMPRFEITGACLVRRGFSTGTAGERVFIGEPGESERDATPIAVFGEQLMHDIQDAGPDRRWRWVVEIGSFNGKPSMVLRGAEPVEPRRAI